MEVPKIYPRSSELDFKCVRYLDWEGDLLSITDGLVSSFRDATDREIIGHYQVDCTELREFLEAKRAGKELSKPKWIPVTERLPEKFENVLVANKRGKHYDIDKGWWNGSFFDRCAKGSYSNVTHWMPLPEPPKEG